MRTYRWFLFNIVVCSWLLDLNVTMLFGPVVLLPEFGLCSTGMLRFTGAWGPILGLSFSCVLIGMCSVSVINALFYRLATVIDKEERLLSKAGIAGMVLYQSLNTTAAICTGWLVVPSVMDERAAYVERAKRFPPLAALVNSFECIGIGSLNSTTRVAFVIGVIQVVFTNLFIGLAMIGFSVILLLRQRQMMSKNTYKMHKNLIVSLVMQLAVPFVTFLVPIVVIVAGAWTGQNNLEGIFPYLIQMLSSHSVCNTLTMVICTVPYRKALLRMAAHSWNRLSGSRQLTADTTTITTTTTIGGRRFR